MLQQAGQFEEQSAVLCHQLFSPMLGRYVRSGTFVDFSTTTGYTADAAADLAPADDVEIDALIVDTVYIDDDDPSVRRDSMLPKIASAVQHLIHFVEILSDVIDIDRDGHDLCNDNWRELTRPLRV
jgi:hypothetical protein